MTHIRNNKYNNTKNYINNHDINNHYSSNTILGVLLLITNILFIIIIINLKKNRKIISNNLINKSTQSEPEFLLISINPDNNLTIIKEI